MRKKYFMIVDVETTMDNTVADFAAVIANSKGEWIAQCAVIIPDELKKGLFFDYTAHGSAAIWTRENATKRSDRYQEMIVKGERMAANVPAINRWLAKAAITYNPILTAYNLSFDVSRCANTGIDLELFDQRRFCLWYASNAMLIRGKDCKVKKDFLQHCINHYYLTAKFNFRTNAEAMAHYITGEEATEPHTALEDILFFELPILRAIIKKRGAIVERGYNWREFRLQDLVKPA